MNSNEKSGRELFEQDFEAFLREDDSPLAALYRKLPQAEPDAALDASILAMAHRAVQGDAIKRISPRQRRRRSTWLPLFATAAGVVFAATVALRMAPQMWGARSDNDVPAMKRDKGVVNVRSVDTPAPSAPLSPPPPLREEPAATARVTPQPSSTTSASHNAVAAKPDQPAVQELAKAKDERTPPLAAAPEPAPAMFAKPGVAEQAADNAAVADQTKASPPAQAQAFPEQAKQEHERRRPVEMDAVERKQAIAAGAWQNLHETEHADAAAGTATNSPSANVRAKVAPAQSAPTPRPQAAMAAAPPPSPENDRGDASNSSGGYAPPPQAAADAKSRETLQVTGGLVAVPKTVAEDPQHWIERIRVLFREHRNEEAMRELKKFREQYRNYELTRDLRDIK